MALEEISLSQSGHFNAKSATEASSLLNAISRFGFIVALVVSTKVLGYLKSLSTELQGREVDIVAGFRMVDTVHTTLQEVRFSLTSVLCDSGMSTARSRSSFILPS